jgi:hypothetical protein
VTDRARASLFSPLTGALCVVVLVAMAAAIGYAAWIAILNFSRIGV